MLLRSLIVGLLLSLALPLAAQAATQVIPGDGTGNTNKLTIYAGDNGSLQAKRGAPGDNVEGMFYGSDHGPAADYWHLRVKGAPALNQTFGPREGGVVPVSNGPVTGNWTPASPAQVETVMHVQHNGVNLFEVKQTVLYVGFDLRFRVVWQVRNIDPQNRTIPFVFGTSSDLYIDSSDAGVGIFIDGPSRFVGGSNDQSRTTGGLQEVTASRLPGEPTPTAIPRWASYEEGGYSGVTGRLAGADAFLNTIDPNLVDNGVGVSFDDRISTGLAPGATVRYEVIWHLSRPTPLSASPSSASKELPGSHTVTLSLVDANFAPVAGTGVRVERSGVNAAPAHTVTTDAQGLAQITWNGSTAGLDSLLAYVDADGDATQDPDEPAATATVRWLIDNHVDGPPTVTPPPGVTPTIQNNPANSEAPTYQFGYAQMAAAGFTDCLFDQRTGRNLDLPVSATLQPGGGTISNVGLYVLDPARHDPSDRSVALPSAALADGTADQNGNVYGFTIPCVVNGEMWLEFTLTEGPDTETFRVPIGGLQLIDPQGVVHDGARYDAAIAAGSTPEEARAAAAIAGATVRLQRQTASGFVNVLSGDPGITPNVNPQTTSASGIYQWDVSPGTYRVLVSADGCQSVIAGPVDIPPPVLDLHVRMDCGSGGGGGGTGTGDSGPGADSGQSEADRTAPVLSRLRITPKRFRVTGAAGGATPRGTKVTLNLSEPSTVVLSIERIRGGRTVGGSCRPSTAAIRGRPLCRRYVRVAQVRPGVLAGGDRTLSFSGRVGRVRLVAGMYRMKASPTDAAGNRGIARGALFTVVAR